MFNGIYEHVMLISNFKQLWAALKQIDWKVKCTVTQMASNNYMVSCDISIYTDQ